MVAEEGGGADNRTPMTTANARNFMVAPQSNHLGPWICFCKWSARENDRLLNHGVTSIRRGC